MRQASVVVLVALSLAACGGTGGGLPQAGRAPRTTRIEMPGRVLELNTEPTTGAVGYTIEVDPDRAWQVLPIAYSAIGLPGTVLDGDARVFGFQKQRMPRRLDERPLTAYVDCGRSLRGPNALYYEVTLDVLTQVSPGKKGSVLVTQVEGFARDRAVSGHPVSCSSRGFLEKVIAEKVRQLLGDG